MATDLDGLQPVIDSASPAPWEVSLSVHDAVIAPNRPHSTDSDETRYYGGPVVGESIQGPDQVFIVIAREALPALVAELRAAQACVDRVRAHVLNDEIYCAKCMEALVAYEKAAGLPVTTPEATRTHTGQFTIQLTEEANTNGR